MLIFYSNFILQENTAKAKISEKVQSKPVYRRIEVATENWGRDRKLSCQSVPSHNITKFSFEEEIEVLNRVKSLLEERSCDKGNVVGTKGNI